MIQDIHADYTYVLTIALYFMKTVNITYHENREYMSTCTIKRNYIIMYEHACTKVVKNWWMELTVRAVPYGCVTYRLEKNTLINIL